ncbi:class I SAM-dependent methyltransferase [Roseobacteraceae bacterium S113]
MKRFSHGSRYSKYVKDICDISAGKNNPVVLDYGTGDGYFFNLLSEHVSEDFKLFAYEPVDEQYQQLLANVDSHALNVSPLNSLDGFEEKCDIILCAEVLEHFAAPNIIGILDDMAKLIKEDGTLIVSVPIETGLAGSLKNAARFLLGQMHGKLGMRKAWRSFWGLPFYRGPEFYLPSHYGFSHLRLEYLLLDCGWDIMRKEFTPIPALRGACNSQVFFICQLRD